MRFKISRFGEGSGEPSAALTAYETSLRSAGVLVALGSVAGSDTTKAPGRYWTIRTRTKDEAIRWAALCPASDGDVIEIREVRGLHEFPAEVVEGAARFAELLAPSRTRRSA